jgi:hypothetical protein
MDLEYMSSLHYRQSTKPTVLYAIQNPDVNLVVWQDPLSSEAKQYLDRLSPKAMVNSRWREGYWSPFNFTPMKAPFEEYMNGLFQSFPEGKGKAALCHDFVTLASEFSEAVQEATFGLTFLIFKPSMARVWHSDGMAFRGSITLRGQSGTLWRSNRSLAGVEKASKDSWGKIDPAQSCVRTVQPHDFFIFKGSRFDNPLVHGTPPKPLSRDYRLFASFEVQYRR